MHDAHQTTGEQKGDGDLKLMPIVLDRPDSVPERLSRCRRRFASGDGRPRERRRWRLGIGVRATLLRRGSQIEQNVVSVSPCPTRSVNVQSALVHASIKRCGSSLF
jgi:hypothetical protein